MAWVPTVLSKGARLAGLLAARSSEARRTMALPSNMVAGGTRRAVATLGAGLSKPAIWTGVLAV